MLKLMGAVLIWAGCTAWGTQASVGLKKRTRVLRELAESLELLERELVLRHTELPVMLVMAAEQTKKEVRSFYNRCRSRIEKGESFTYAWEQSVNLLPICQTSRALLHGLGGILGQFDAQGQVEALCRVRKELERRCVCSEEEQRTLGRMYGMLGVTAGSFLAVLLL